MNILRLLEPMYGSSLFLYSPNKFAESKIGILRKKSSAFAWEKKNAYLGILPIPDALECINYIS